MALRLNLEPTRRSVILLAVLALLGLLMCFGVAVVGFSEVKSERDSLLAKQAELEDSRAIAQRLERSQQNYDDALQELHYLEQNVSTKSYIPTLLKQLEALGRSVHLKVVEVRPVVEAQPMAPAGGDGDGKDAEKPAPKSPFQGQRIDVTVEGAYANALSMLYRLTTFPKIMTVNSVEARPVASRARGGASSDLEFKFNITAYVLDDEGSAARPRAASFSQHRKQLEEVDAGKNGR